MSLRQSIETDFRRRFGTNRFLKQYDLEGMLLIAPVITVFILVTVIPVAYGIWLSLHTGRGAAELTWTGFSNYQGLVESQPFFDSIWVGLYYAVYSVALQVVLGVLIALALNNFTRFSSIVRAIIFVPYMIPTVAIAVVFKMMLNTDIGIINWLLIQIGLIEQGINFLGLDWAMHTVVWASAWKWSIFVVILVLARLQSIDQNLYEMAKTNGASTFRQFLDVTYPNIKSVLFLVILLRSIWMFNKFDMIWLLTQGGPLGDTTTMVILAYRRGFGEFSFGTASAITTIMFLMLFVFGIYYFRTFRPEDEVEVRQ